MVETNVTVMSQLQGMLKIIFNEYLAYFKSAGHACDVKKTTNFGFISSVTGISDIMADWQQTVTGMNFSNLQTGNNVQTGKL